MNVSNKRGINTPLDFRCFVLRCCSCRSERVHRSEYVKEWGLTLATLKYFCLNHEDQMFFKFEIIINVLVNSFCFVWIPMLCVYRHYNLCYSFSAGTVFRRQNLTSADVRFWRLKTVLALKGLNLTNTTHWLWRDPPLIYMTKLYLPTVQPTCSQSWANVCEVGAALGKCCAAFCWQNSKPHSSAVCSIVAGNN